MSRKTIGFAMCGSFCTFSKAFAQMAELARDFDILPIMSENAYNTDTRFGAAEDFRRQAEEICGRKIIHTIGAAEPIGPEKLCDLVIVAPCTGNTLAKLAGGITDTAVTMAVKSHLRVLRPVLLCPATNDGLSASAQNIGRLLNVKNIYFVPMKQDDCLNKPNSLVADFGLLPRCAEEALNGRQERPVFVSL